MFARTRLECLATTITVTITITTITTIIIIIEAVMVDVGIIDITTIPEVGIMMVGMERSLRLLGRRRLRIKRKNFWSGIGR
jgi:hypothetical protein